MVNLKLGGGTGRGGMVDRLGFSLAAAPLIINIPEYAFRKGRSVHTPVRISETLDTRVLPDTQWQSNPHLRRRMVTVTGADGKPRQAANTYRYIFGDDLENLLDVASQADNAAFIPAMTKANGRRQNACILLPVVASLNFACSPRIGDDGPEYIPGEYEEAKADRDGVYRDKAGRAVTWSGEPVAVSDPRVAHEDDRPGQVPSLNRMRIDSYLIGRGYEPSPLGTPDELTLRTIYMTDVAAANGLGIKDFERYAHTGDMPRVLQAKYAATPFIGDPDIIGRCVKEYETTYDAAKGLRGQLREAAARSRNGYRDHIDIDFLMAQSSEPTQAQMDVLRAVVEKAKGVGAEAEAAGAAHATAAEADVSVAKAQAGHDADAAHSAADAAVAEARQAKATGEPDAARRAIAVEGDATASQALADDVERDKERRANEEARKDDAKAQAEALTEDAAAVAEAIEGDVDEKDAEPKDVVNEIAADAVDAVASVESQTAPGTDDGNGPDATSGTTDADTQEAASTVAESFDDAYDDGDDGDDSYADDDVPDF